MFMNDICEWGCNLLVLYQLYQLFNKQQYFGTRYVCIVQQCSLKSKDKLWSDFAQ